MSWVDQIKDVPLRQLEAFSRTGEIVAVDTQASSSFAGTQSQLFIKDAEGAEFAVRASASALGRPGHRLTVVYLSKDGRLSGYDVAYYNHAMRQLTYDKLVSGASDGSHRADLEGPPIVEGCLAAIGAVIVAAIFTSLAGFAFGAITPIVSFGIALIGLYILLRKYAFKDGEKRVKHIRDLVEAEVRTVAAAD